MFLIERIFGITCYFLALLFVFIVIYYRKMRVKDALILYIIILAIFAYFYEPYETADLFRIRDMMVRFSGYDFKTFYKLILSSSSSPVAYSLYWLIGCIGNVRLLPVIVVLITYSIIFYIIYQSAKLYSLSSPSVAILVFFVMSTGNYMMAISGIRNMLAIAILCFCFFRESILKKFKLWHVVLYLAAALTHNLALILIVIRCIALVISSRLKFANKILIAMVFFSGGVFCLFRFEWLLADIYDKAIEYITGDSYSYIWEYLIGFLALVIEIKAIRMNRRNLEPMLRENRTYLLLCIITACVFAFQFSIFQRLVTYISPILAIPMLASGFSKPNIRNKYRNRVFYISLIMLGIACTRGELCSLKFFVL